MKTFWIARDSAHRKSILIFKNEPFFIGETTSLQDETLTNEDYGFFCREEFIEYTGIDIRIGEKAKVRLQKEVAENTHGKG